MKATLGWGFLRRSTPELSTPSPQTGDSKAIAATLVAQLTTLLLPNRIQTLPGFLPFSEWPVVFWKVSPITNPRAVIILAGEGPRLRNVVLRRGNCTGSFWETFPSPSARRPDREELLLSASRCCHKAVAPVAPSEDEADRLGMAMTWLRSWCCCISHPCRWPTSLQTHTKFSETLRRGILVTNSLWDEKISDGLGSWRQLSWRGICQRGEPELQVCQRKGYSLIHCGSGLPRWRWW